jgi:energy-coupling factor transport system permease protein
MPNAEITNFMSNVEGTSWVHRLDPRTKIAIIMFFSIMPLIFSDPVYVLAIAVLVLPLWITAKVNLRSLAGPLFAVGVFLVVIFVFNAIRLESQLQTPELDPTNPYSSYTWFYNLGPIYITNHSVDRAVFMAGRLVVPLTIGLLVVATTDPTYMAKGLRKLKMPIEVVFMVLAALRFIPIVTEQLFNILDAQTIRGVGKNRWQRFKLLLFPLFISSLRRTRTMGLACESKGFGAHKWNNFIESFNLDTIDKATLIMVGVISLTLLIMRFVFGLGVEMITRI